AILAFCLDTLLFIRHSYDSSDHAPAERPAGRSLSKSSLTTRIRRRNPGKRLPAVKIGDSKISGKPWEAANQSAAAAVLRVCRSYGARSRNAIPITARMT